MGFTSVLVFNNDYLNRIETKTLKEIHGNAEIARMVGRYSSGVAAGVEMPWNDHADSYCLMMVGGYSAKVLTTTFDHRCQGPAETDRIEAELLRQLANKHGYNLHKKRAKK